MPLEQHPTDPDKMVYASRHYDIPQLQGVTTTQRPWVGLTDDEFKKIIDDAGFTRTDLLMIGDCVEQLADLVEATLRSKNT